MTSVEKKVKSAPKKQNTNSWYCYVRKTLKEFSSCNLAKVAGDQVDRCIRRFAEQLSAHARATCLHNNKQTVGEKEIKLAANMLLPTHILAECTAAMDDALELYAAAIKTKSNEGRSPPVRREVQAGLLMSVALADKYIRQFGTTKLNVSRESPVALAAILQCIVTRTLSLATSVADTQKKKTITIRHIMLAAHQDESLQQLLNNFGIEFYRAGVYPYTLAPRNLKKKALKEIKKHQKDVGPLLRKLPFARATRNLSFALNEECNFNLKKIHFGEVSIDIIQQIVEQRCTTLLSTAVELAEHAKRQGVTSKDIRLAWRLTESLIPYTDVEVDEIGNNGIRRIGYRAGVERKSRSMYSEMKRYIQSFLTVLLKNILVVISHNNVITVQVDDINVALSSLGIHLTIPSSLKKSKARKKRVTEEDLGDNSDTNV